MRTEGEQAVPASASSPSRGARCTPAEQRLLANAAMAVLVPVGPFPLDEVVVGRDVADAHALALEQLALRFDWLGRGLGVICSCWRWVSSSGGRAGGSR